LADDVDGSPGNCWLRAPRFGLGIPSVKCELVSASNVVGGRSDVPVRLQKGREK
jgi:hypothetical protein